MRGIEGDYDGELDQPRRGPSATGTAWCPRPGRPYLEPRRRQAPLARPGALLTPFSTRRAAEVCRDPKRRPRRHFGLRERHTQPSYYVGWPPGVEPQVLTTFGDPEAGLCLDEIDHGDELRRPFDAKTQPTPASKPDEGGPLAGLMAGEDVHGNARDLVGRMIARGEEDAVIRLLFQPIAEAVAATRGPERAADLMGSELDRLIRGARFKEFAPFGANAEWGEMEPLPLALAPVMPFDAELSPSARALDRGYLPSGCSALPITPPSPSRRRAITPVGKWPSDPRLKTTGP